MLIASAIQFNPRLASCPADIMDNFRRLGPLVRQAMSVGTNFLVFPELCLTGYSFLSKSEAALVAEDQYGATFNKMRGVALSLNSYVSWGYIRIDSVAKCFRNSATMVSPKGDIIAQYDKINLWGNDFLWAIPGSNPPSVVETIFGKTSLVICRDLRDKIPHNIPRTASKEPSLFEDQSVNLVAACVNWGKGGYPSTSWMDFATNNDCTLVVANRWGEETNGSFSQDFGHGGSAIVESSWKVHTGGMVFNSDCVVTAAISER